MDKNRIISKETDGLAVAAVCVLLAAIVWIGFGQTVWHHFINYDDGMYVYQNPHVLRGPTRKGLVWSLTFASIGHWHPVTWWSHMLDCRLFGLWAGGHHLTNVLLHGSVAILLFLTLHQMTGSLLRSGFVAALFAVHPLRVESVAWISERKDVLSGIFFMLTLLAYGRYAREGSRRAVDYSLVLIFFALGLMSKGMLVTLPFVLLLLDYWPLERFNGRDGALRRPPNKATVTSAPGRKDSVVCAFGVVGPGHNSVAGKNCACFSRITFRAS